MPVVSRIHLNALNGSVCDSVHGGVGMVALGGHAWLLGGVCGCFGGEGHVWLLWGVHVCCWGGGVVALRGAACMVALGGMHGCPRRDGHVWLLQGGAWDMTRYRDTINERAVCILLECILVLLNVSIYGFSLSN